MAHKQPSRVRDVTATTGTGAYTLAGTAPQGCRTFAAALADGDTVNYVALLGLNYEVGRGTWSASAGTLARTHIYKSSNADAEVDWPAGVKDIFAAQPGISDLDATGLALYVALLGVLANMVEDTTPQLGGNLDLNGHALVFPSVTLTDVLDEDNMASNSATKGATQQSIKAYADALLAANDAMIFKGVIDCSGNPNYPAADAGHVYSVSVAGKIGGGSGVNVEVGDSLLCIADSTASGNQATVGTSWVIRQANIDGAVTGPASVTSGHAAIFSGTSGKVIASAGAAPLLLGKHTIWIPAKAMAPATTNGPASGQVESSTNKINYPVLDFDGATAEYAHFQIAFPKSWNLGTVSFRVWWRSSATDTDGVAWLLQGVAMSDGDSTDPSWGTAVAVTDAAQSSATKMYVTAESAAVTIAGTPAAADVVAFRFYRDPANGSDNMAEDARLIGIQLFYTLNLGSDD